MLYNINITNITTLDNVCTGSGEEPSTSQLYISGLPNRLHNLFWMVFLSSYITDALKGVCNHFGNQFLSYATFFSHKLCSFLQIVNRHHFNVPKGRHLPNTKLISTKQSNISTSSDGTISCTAICLITGQPFNESLHANQTSKQAIINGAHIL